MGPQLYPNFSKNQDHFVNFRDSNVQGHKIQDVNVQGHFVEGAKKYDNSTGIK
jgi:hypothetical protein